MKRIMVDLGKCTGCRTCEIVCSFERETVFNPKKSAIRVVKEELIGLDAPVVCQLCNHPKCVESCPEGALEKTLPLGVIKVKEEKCTGCRTCEEACPYGALSMHPDRDIPIICNLCDGKPACVDWCHAKALNFSSPRSSERAQSKRFKTALTQYCQLMKKWEIPDLDERGNNHEKDRSL